MGKGPVAADLNHLHSRRAVVGVIVSPCANRAIFTQALIIDEAHGIDVPQEAVRIPAIDRLVCRIADFVTRQARYLRWAALQPAKLAPVHRLTACRQSAAQCGTRHFRRQTTPGINAEARGNSRAITGHRQYRSFRTRSRSPMLSTAMNYRPNTGSRQRGGLSPVFRTPPIVTGQRRIRHVILATLMDCPTTDSRWPPTHRIQGDHHDPRITCRDDDSTTRSRSSALELAISPP